METSQSNTSAIANHAILVKLSAGSWSGKIKDTKVSDEVKRNAGASNNAGVFIKTLLTPEALAPLTFIAAQARAVHYQLTMPWDDNGQRLLPSKLIMQYQETMDKFVEQRVDARIEFLSRYDAFVQERQSALGTMFNESDYPTAEELKERFTMSYAFSQIADTTHFVLDVAQKEQEAIKKNIESTLITKVATATTSLYQRLGDLVHTLAERMDETSNSSLRNSLINDLVFTVQVLPDLNVMDNPELSRMNNRIKEALMTLNDPDELRPRSTSFDAEKYEQVKSTVTEVSNELHEIGIG